MNFKPRARLRAQTLAWRDKVTDRVYRIEAAPAPVLAALIEAMGQSQAALERAGPRIKP